MQLYYDVIGDFMINDVVYNVLINLISTLVTSAVLILLAFLYYQIRRASIMKDIRRLISPQKRVIRCQKISGVFRVSDTTPFDNVYDDNEIRELLSFTGKKNAFNGKCVRLDRINEDGSIELSIVGFFDFMTTNLLLLMRVITRKPLMLHLIKGILPCSGMLM